jgi:hypothetical protein
VLPSSRLPTPRGRSGCPEPTSHGVACDEVAREPGEVRAVTGRSNEPYRVVRGAVGRQPDSMRYQIVDAVHHAAANRSALGDFALQRVGRL